jgi:excisionase family DNA binding protein
MKHGTERQTLTVEEAGQKLGISRNSAYEAARKGEIPTIRIGRLLLVPRAAFERLLDHPVTAKTEAAAA